MRREVKGWANGNSAVAREKEGAAEQRLAFFVVIESIYK